MILVGFWVSSTVCRRTTVLLPLSKSEENSNRSCPCGREITREDVFESFGTLVCRRNGVADLRFHRRQSIRLPKTISAQQNFDGTHVQDKRITLPQDAQKGRPARPQRVKGRGVPSGVR